MFNKAGSPEWWKETKIDELPEKWQRAIKRLYAAYPIECLPKGISDPTYICNIIALEIGAGDGQGNFNA